MHFTSEVLLLRTSPAEVLEVLLLCGSCHIRCCLSFIELRCALGLVIFEGPFSHSTVALATFVVNRFVIMYSAALGVRLRRQLTFIKASGLGRLRAHTRESSSLVRGRTGWSRRVARRCPFALFCFRFEPLVNVFSDTPSVCLGSQNGCLERLVFRCLRGAFKRVFCGFADLQFAPIYREFFSGDMPTSGD